MQSAHRSPNNHIGRRHVQRHSGTSGPVTRILPGTPEYERIMESRTALRSSTSEGEIA